MSERAVIGLLLCALVFGATVGTLVCALCLRVAIRLYNRLAGGASSPSSVPEPTLGKAMWITFAIFVAQVIVGMLVIGPVGGDGAMTAGARGSDVVTQVISIPVSFLIAVGILSAKLPTTFGRAILVSLCDMLVSLLVSGVLVGIAVVVLGVALIGR
jgi:hypothetical protein